MRKRDISIYEKTDSMGNVRFSIENLRATKTGEEKVLGLWLKAFYGKEGGGVVNLIKTTKLSKSTESEYSQSVVMAIMRTNQRVLDIQSVLEDIPDDERFEDCQIKSLDIQANKGLMNLKLEFSTKSSSTEITI